MPLLHCDSCHHEWEGLKDSPCTWCSASSHVLKEETELERYIKHSRTTEGREKLERIIGEFQKKET